jgi:hypothetical protein
LENDPRQAGEPLTSTFLGDDPELGTGALQGPLGDPHFLGLRRQFLRRQPFPATERGSKEIDRGVELGWLA